MASVCVAASLFSWLMTCLPDSISRDNLGSCGDKKEGEDEDIRQCRRRGLLLLLSLVQKVSGSTRLGDHLYEIVRSDRSVDRSRLEGCWSQSTPSDQESCLIEPQVRAYLQLGYAHLR